MDKIVNRGDDITVCLPGAKTRGYSREGKTSPWGGGTGVAVLVHVGNEQCREGGKRQPSLVSTRG